MLGFPLTCMVGKRAKENSFFWMDIGFVLRQFESYSFVQLAISHIQEPDPIWTLKPKCGEVHQYWPWRQTGNMRLPIALLSHVLSSIWFVSTWRHTWRQSDNLLGLYATCMLCMQSCKLGSAYVCKVGVVLVCKVGVEFVLKQTNWNQMVGNCHSAGNDNLLRPNGHSSVPGVQLHGYSVE